MTGTGMGVLFRDRQRLVVSMDCRRTTSRGRRRVALRGPVAAFAREAS